MTRLLHHAPFAAGLFVVAWIGAGYLPDSPLALLLVGLIGAVFMIGAAELNRYRWATAGLAARLAATAEPPSSLAPWLAELPASLRHAVRLRVEGERVPLPGPALSTYLAGLLVLLGMLGTFLGMVVTLQGTGVALENAADVDAVRASLAAPIKGLGLAFGTSVAGVAASAMLGLMSALARRERQRAAQGLDAAIATTLRVHSRAYQREESLRLQALQAQALPALVAQIQGLVLQTERQGQALHEGLLASQAGFQGAAQRAYTGLAESVDRSLRASLTDSARLAGAVIEPAVQATLAGLARQATTLLDGMAARQEGLTRHTHDTLSATVAGVVAETQRALGASLVRDNAALDERNRLMGTLAGLVEAVSSASHEQSGAIDALVRTTTAVLDRAGARFAQTVDAGSGTLQGVAAQVTASAAEVASLGEGFGLAVQLFSRATEQLSAQLQRIEGALGQSMARSDEQLAYYVAQAREIIDLTLGSQKQMVDDLQQLSRAPRPPAALAGSTAAAKVGAA
jgi:hypothetical protein